MENKLLSGAGVLAGWMSVPRCFPEYGSLSEALMSLFFDRVIKFTLRESVSSAKKTNPQYTCKKLLS